MCGAYLTHEAVWMVLEDLIAEFRRLGETIPSETMEDLRSAKSLIQVLRADPSRSKDASQIEVYLENIESYLISKAQEKFGQAFVERWMNKLREARAEDSREIVVGSTVSKFLPSMPKEASWVRVKISKDIPREAVEAIARENGLLTRIQEGAYLLIYGEEEKLKTFVKKMTEKFRGARKP
jgi:hypothetical protein